MVHKAWSSVEEVPYCFSRSSVKFQGHTALKIAEFDPDWAFPDCNSSLNLPMATKWCTKLEVALKRCPIVFEGHPSNFKFTSKKKSSILTQIRRFRTVTQGLKNRRFESNMSKITRPVAAIKSLRFACSRSFAKFQGHTTQNIVEFEPDWAFPDCNSSLNPSMAKKWCPKLEVA